MPWENLFGETPRRSVAQLALFLSLPLSFLLSFSVFLRLSLSFSPFLFLSAWLRHSVSWSGSGPVIFFVWPLVSCLGRYHHHSRFPYGSPMYLDRVLFDWFPLVFALPCSQSLPTPTSSSHFLSRSLPHCCCFHLRLSSWSSPPSFALCKEAKAREGVSSTVQVSFTQNFEGRRAWAK
jgi:hypothetical protein